MKAVYEWKDMLKIICAEKGWYEDKNCKITYEAHADVESDTLKFIAKIRPFTQIEEITIEAVLE